MSTNIQILFVVLALATMLTVILTNCNQCEFYGGL
jgi:hypothetical protein